MKIARRKIIKKNSLLVLRKIIIVYLLFFLQTLVFVNYNTNVYASEHFNDEMKKISNVTVGDKFTDDTILVTLKNTTSLKREYSIYDFTNLDLIDVIDISN